jgi:hypothetical protein
VGNSFEIIAMRLLVPDSCLMTPALMFRPSSLARIVSVRYYPAFFQFLKKL